MNPARHFLKQVGGPKLALAAILIAATAVPGAAHAAGVRSPPTRVRNCAPPPTLPGTASEVNWVSTAPALGVPADPTAARTSTSACQVFPGDGAGSGPALSYVDNGDGTVTDLNTLFMWEKKVAGGSGLSTCLTLPHGVDSMCKWADATGAWIAVLNAGSGYAGHTDWRLPNVRELQSIVDFSVVDPSISATFGPTASGVSLYWSATSYANGSGDAWYVGFATGNVNFDNKIGGGFHVRAVRGGP